MKKYFLTLFLLTSFALIANAQFTKLGGGLGFTSGYYFHEMEYDYNKSGHLPISLKGIYESKPAISYFTVTIVFYSSCT